ncbi:MAG: ABC transporter permease [Gammaproteobacteria bacterium]|nr:ABC transporter permease [Gammaproteobacteria bacterium]
MNGNTRDVPAWVSVALLPLVNILLAFAISGLIIIVIGEDPLQALNFLIAGAFGSQEAIGYTLYYSTNLIFTGLAVAVAFHTGLFNIGAEGQAYVGGLGVALICLAFDTSLPSFVIIPLCMIAAALFGAAWAFLPGYLQATRGSHIVITTIMFNFIASALMVYLLVNVLIKPGQMAPETRVFADTAWMPFAHDAAAALGVSLARSPLNLSFLFALFFCIVVWLFIWRTRWGYAIRTVGQNEAAAVYAGIKSKRIVILAMSVSGGLAGFVALNEVLGVQHRLLIDFVAGYGFTGIAVALMGRNHPMGVVFAALLFGALYQGGAELAFEIPTITRDMVVVIQGLVILFCGALEFMLKPHIEALYLKLQSPQGWTG